MKFSIASLLFLILFFSCDAPRQNPFDPQAENYYQPSQNIVTSTVLVKRLYPPFTPIAGVHLLEPTLNVFGVTDSQGRFVFDHPVKDSLHFIAYADQFFSDTLTFAHTLNNQYTIYLNAKPQIENVQFTSVFNNVYETFSFTSLNVQAQISDLDGPLDIDTVYFFNEEFNFDTTLNMDGNDHINFNIEFEIKKIDPNLTPEQLPELNFYLKVKNNNGQSVTDGPFVIRRVIDQFLVQLSPQESEVTRDSVVFSWVNPELPYDYVFNISLTKFPTLEKIKYTGIPKDQTTFVVKNLAPGRYTWTLQVQDNLNNLCQSQFISFYHE